MRDKYICLFNKCPYKLPAGKDHWLCPFVGCIFKGKQLYFKADSKKAKLLSRGK